MAALSPRAFGLGPLPTAVVSGPPEPGVRDFVPGTPIPTSGIPGPKVGIPGPQSRKFGSPRPRIRQETSGVVHEFATRPCEPPIWPSWRLASPAALPSSGLEPSPLASELDTFGLEPPQPRKRRQGQRDAQQCRDASTAL